MALKGIVIDPGHGGTDSGAVSNNIKEKDYTLLISKYMYDRFKELGIPVKLTRDTDVTLSPKERASKIKSFFGNSKDVIVISNHLNAGGGDGAEVIYALRNTGTLSKKILDEIEKEGQNVRKYYQLRLPNNPIKDYYFIHRDTPNNEAIIVEYGFVDSPKDDVKQIKNDYKKYAEAVVRAVCEYKGIKYVAPSGFDYYTVKKGDSLWSIANKYGTTVNKLKELNKLTSNVLKIGQTLKISDAKEITTSSYLSYKVQKGDNLYTIANKYDVTIDDIKKLNNLSSTVLQIGQVLKIPGSTNYNTYIVKKGDNLWDIANKYGTTVKKIMTINNLNSTLLKIGQSLLIPTN